MKKTILSLLLILSAVFLFTACPVPLSSSLPADLVLTLGRFNSTGGLTNLRAAVGGTLSVPVLITDQTGKETTTAYSVLFTLSVDADLETTADNTEVGTESVTAGTETVLDLTVPAAITAAGTYYLFGAIDAADAAENNNKIGRASCRERV